MTNNLYQYDNFFKYKKAKKDDYETKLINLEKQIQEKLKNYTKYTEKSKKEICSSFNIRKKFTEKKEAIKKEQKNKSSVKNPNCENKILYDYNKKVIKEIEIEEKKYSSNIMKQTLNEKNNTITLNKFNTNKKAIGFYINTEGKTLLSLINEYDKALKSNFEINEKDNSKNNTINPFLYVAKYKSN